MNNNRKDYMDIAKGIALLMVLWAHFNFHFNIINVDIINGFHMPIFFFISGYFLSNKYNIFIFIKRRFKQLIIPYFLGVVLKIIFTILLNYLDGSIPNIKTLILGGLTGNGAGVYWFLLALFLGSVVMYLYIENKYFLLIGIIFAYIGITTKSLVVLPFRIQPALFSCFYLALGYECRKRNVFENKPKVCSLLLCLIMYFFSLKYHIALSVVNTYVTHGLLSIIASLCVVYFVIYLSKGLGGVKCKLNLGNKIISFLKWLGFNSLIVYFIHALEMNVIPWSNILNNWITYNNMKNIDSICLFVIRFIMDILLAFIVIKLRIVINKLSSRQ